VWGLIVDMIPRLLILNFLNYLSIPKHYI